MSVLPLKCGYQPYAWGKPGDVSTVASLVGESDASKRYAELWIGTHPSKPAVVAADPDTTLASLLEKDSKGTLGEQHVGEFGAKVPFLLKVLSIDKALSIQAHPVKSHAEQLHAKDPAHYPDDNHKPELVVALTPFQALCCFRPLAEVKAFVAEIPALKNLLPNSHGLSGASDKESLRAALGDLYAQPASAVQAAIDAHKAVLLNAAPNGDVQQLPGLADRVFLRVESEFPGDVGAWMVYILNIVEMKPGDGLFMAPNEPHSYLQGDCVEIMAASDNVVRAGLTPKFKDVDVLLEMLTYRTDALEGVSYKADPSNPAQRYAPPEWCTEFALTAVRLGGGTTQADMPALPSAALGVVVDGSVVLNGTTLPRGSTFFVPATTSTAVGNTIQLAEGADHASVFFGTTRGVDRPTGAAARL
eukprot:CAMPEP_0174864748 /NCGR_PEP_ID=MMETSP1114-20130205/59084_1 /TAXON_ID=312471 /ORGANISM="Neobodo designis, Strain CCAP 1951/1" /LENGTH=416 /DNA_ID=CAMNT_0016099857 /DNA_START=92 /DNA_END=1342 /DNA_ORIENTATION=-